jgi:nucleotide-binding universal stress UspA family protein
MAENANITATRVIVSCDASPLGTTAIDAAAALAHRLDAELKGIFVEDINLIRTAALPFTQEVASSTALARRMHSGQLQRLLEQQAQSVRDVLREAASTLKLQWSFQVVRGAPLSSVLDVMRGLDLAVFGHAGRFSTRPAAAAPFMARQPVMVVFDGTPAAQRALDASAALAQDTQARLVVAVIARGGEEAGLRAKAFQQIERRPQPLMQRGPRTPALFITLKQRDARTVAHAVETYAPAVVLWGGIAGDADRATLATLVDALKCPVVLVA